MAAKTIAEARNADGLSKYRIDVFGHAVGDGQLLDQTHQK